jgi:hypothetical protein
METAKKSLVDMALKVNGKSGTTGTLTVGSTPKNKKGLLDLVLDIGGDAQNQDRGAGEDQDLGNGNNRKKRFSLALDLLPSVAGGLLNLGIDVLGGRNEKDHRKRHRRARKNGIGKI